MKKISTPAIILLIVAIFSCSSASIKPLPLKERLLIAVSDFQNISGDKEYDSLMNQFSGNLIYEIQKTKCFRLIERQRLQAIMKEHNLNMAGLVDPLKQKKIGKILGVDALLIGNLASVNYSIDKKEAGKAKMITEKIDVTIDARLVAIETGEILASSKKMIPVENTYYSIGEVVKKGEALDKKSLVLKALSGSCKPIAHDLASQVSQR